MGRASRSNGMKTGASNITVPSPGSQEFQPLAKALAGNDKEMRDKAVRNLRRWLSFRKDMSRLDLMRIWKALFYCMWMSDKIPIQQHLADTIAKLIHCFREPKVGVRFLSCFLETLNREWGGLDHLRMDKFLSLTRKMMLQSLTYLIRNKWNGDILDCLSETLMSQMQQRSGVRRHLVDVFWSEFDEALDSFSGDKTTVDSNVWDQLLEPFVASGSLCRDKVFQRHVMENIFEPLISGERSTTTLRPTASQVSEKLFEMASDPDTVESYRKDLYRLRKRFRKLANLEEVRGEQEGSSAVKTARHNPADTKVTPSKKRSKSKQQSDESTHDSANTPTTTKRRKTKKRSKLENEETTPDSNRVHFDLGANTSQSVAEAKRAARTPIPPAKTAKVPRCGILKTPPTMSAGLRRSSRRRRARK